MTWRTTRVRKAEIERQTVLFSEEAQTLVALNDGATELWRRLEAGLPLHGSGEPGADGAVAEVLAMWARAGLIRGSEEAATEAATEAEHVPTPDRPVGPMVSRSFVIGSVAVRLTVCPALSGQVWPYLVQFPSSRRDPQVVLSVRERGESPGAAGVRTQSATSAARRGAFVLRRGRRLVRRCAREEVVPAIKLQLLAEVLEHGSQVLALHAAALVVDGCFLLVTGPPGAGKSTLAVALLAAGHGFAADDVVLLDADGVARGVPLRPGLKEGAWALLEKELCAAGGDTVHRRPDGRAIRYMPLGRRVTSARHPVGCIVVLSDQDGARCGLTPIGRMDALAVLLAGASAPGDRLSEDAFAALVTLVGNARCYALSRRTVTEAVAAVVRACRELDP